MADIASIAFTLDRQSGAPLFVQLCDGIRQRIARGAVAQGYRMPASRSLAMEMGISRTTVVSAYEQLVAEGYLEGRRGSGYFVCPIGEVEMPLAGPPATKRAKSHHYHRTAPVQPGSPDMRLFPYRQWARCVSRTARVSPEALISSDDPFGDRQLRESISRYLADWRGLVVSSAQILVTAGSIDALETCIRTLTVANDSIGLEDPGYLPLRHFVRSHGFDLHWLRVDDEGVEVPRLQHGEPAPKLLVLTPSHQFPLGGAMSQMQRLAFLRWAEQHNAWILEDDYDSEFRYAGRPIPAMTSYDSSGRAIYIGSFSKVFSSSVRLGYLVMPESLIGSFSDTLSRFGPRASVSAQRPLSAFIDSGEFYRHIRRVRRVYGERRKILIECLQKKLGHLVTFHNHQAGMIVVANLPPHCDDRLIVERVNSRGATAEALSDHYSGRHKRRGLLLGFCAFTEEEIYANAVILREEIEKEI